MALSSVSRFCLASAYLWSCQRLAARYRRATNAPGSILSARSKKDVDSSSFFSIARTVPNSWRTSPSSGSKATALRNSSSAASRFPACASLSAFAVRCSALSPCVVPKETLYVQKAAQEDKRSVQLHRLKTTTRARQSIGRATLVIVFVPTTLRDRNREFTSDDCSAKPVRSM